MAAFLRPNSGVEETANAMPRTCRAALRPNEYDVRRNPDLARTYRMIAEGGRDVFYDGPIAQTIDAYFKRIGGWLSAEDLREHHAEWVEPLVTNYRGVDVYAHAAPTRRDSRRCRCSTSSSTSICAAMGFSRRSRCTCRLKRSAWPMKTARAITPIPHFAKIPIEWLNSKDYAKERAKLIRLDRI